MVKHHLALHKEFDQNSARHFRLSFVWTERRDVLVTSSLLF
jgi:hypothetical protein